MAQPAYAIQYLGAVVCEASTAYTSAEIRTTYPAATVIQMKTDGVKVTVNGAPMFQTKYDDESYIDGATTSTYIFDRDCVLAVGVYKAIT